RMLRADARRGHEGLHCLSRGTAMQTAAAHAPQGQAPQNANQVSCQHPLAVFTFSRREKDFADPEKRERTPQARTATPHAALKTGARRGGKGYKKRDPAPHNLALFHLLSSLRFMTRVLAGVQASSSLSRRTFLALLAAVPLASCRGTAARYTFRLIADDSKEV